MGLVRKESLAVFYTSQQLKHRCVLKKRWENAGRYRLKPATRNREQGRKEEGQASSSVPKVKEQADVHGSKW